MRILICRLPKSRENKLEIVRPILTLKREKDREQMNFSQAIEKATFDRCYVISLSPMLETKTALHTKKILYIVKHELVQMKPNVFIKDLMFLGTLHGPYYSVFHRFRQAKLA